MGLRPEMRIEISNETYRLLIKALEMNIQSFTEGSYINQEAIKFKNKLETYTKHIEDDGEKYAKIGLFNSDAKRLVLQLSALAALIEHIIKQSTSSAAIV